MVDSHSSSLSAGLIDEMKDLVEAKLFSFSCMHVPRACNRAAHELAALGLCCVEGMLLLVLANASSSCSQLCIYCIWFCHLCRYSVHDFVWSLKNVWCLCIFCYFTKCAMYIKHPVSMLDPLTLHHTYQNDWVMALPMLEPDDLKNNSITVRWLFHLELTLYLFLYIRLEHNLDGPTVNGRKLALVENWP